MKKTLTFIVAFILVLSTLGCDKNTKLEGGDKTLVSFSDTALNISTNDLYEVLKEKYGINFLIDMIDEKILDKEYVDSDEINSYVDIQVDSIRNYYETEAEFLEYINSYGYQTVDELKDYFKLNYKRNLAVYDYVESLVSDEELNKYYDEKITGDVTGSHILIEVKTTSSMTEDEKRTLKEDALKKAKEAITKLDEGTSFSDVAKEYSDDTLTSKNGGSMGTFNTLELDNVTKQEFQKLEVGSYSTEPVETEYGYEIFFKESEKEKASKEEVKSKILEVLRNEKLTTDATLQYKGIEELRKEYGFKINDEDLQVYYENTMNNLLSSK